MVEDTKELRTSPMSLQPIPLQRNRSSLHPLPLHHQSPPEYFVSFPQRFGGTRKRPEGEGQEERRKGQRGEN